MVEVRTIKPGKLKTEIVTLLDILILAQACWHYFGSDKSTEPIQSDKASSPQTVLGYYLASLKKAFSLSGRARRAEYLSTPLVNYLLYLSMVILIWLVSGVPSPLIWNLINLISLLSLPLMFSLTVRRLHDIGHSGWYLLWFLTLIGIPVVLFELFLSDSAPGTNEYGPNPKEPKDGQAKQPEGPQEVPASYHPYKKMAM